MKKFLVMTLVAAPLALAACASGPSLPPKAGPEEVDLINPRMGQSPREGYKTIGPVQVEVALGSSFAEQMTALRTRAAEMGADAVIWDGTHRSTEGQISGGVDREEKLLVQGTAIYWPKMDESGGGS